LSEFGVIQFSSTLFRRRVLRSLPSFVFLAAIAAVSSQCAVAQTPSDIVAEGYITAVNPPKGFDLNGERVVTSSNTGFGLIGSNTTQSDSSLRTAVQVGAYVQVVGTRDRRSKSIVAVSVLVRDDWNHVLSGMGVIDKVVTAGPEPIFQADGYQIRITSATHTAFASGLKTLADVGTNAWLRYEGKRNQEGMLVASKAEFVPAKPAKPKAVKGLEEYDMQFQPPRSSLKGGAAPQSGAPPEDVSDRKSILTQDGKVKLGGFGGWHKIPADQALQDRVRHVGVRVIPAYQRELPGNHPSKINFRFYAADAQNIRSEVCSFDGLILIPTQLVERLKNDDQLAAVLADGVAYNLQRQAAREVADNRVLLGAEIAGDVAGVFIPGANLVGLVGSASAANKINTEMQEQRGRVALSLMADAGYDPRQAPEAWRLLAPKHLPTDPSALKYPARSGYQLGILNLQYASEPAATTPKAEP
jgi:hypothetical protein